MKWSLNGVTWYAIVQCLGSKYEYQNNDAYVSRQWRESKEEKYSSRGEWKRRDWSKEWEQMGKKKSVWNMENGDVGE